MLFHAFCYIAATVFVLWLRSDSKPQTDFSQAFQEAIEEHFEQIEQAEAEMKEVEQPQPKQPNIEAIASDIWQTPVVSSAPRYWVRQPQSLKPTLALMPAKEEAKPVTPIHKPASKKSQQPLEANLDNLDAGTLRKLCTKYGIAWRNVRGQNRHATKAMMLHQLREKATA